MMYIAKFFERKKRELSTNNSTEEEASLKKPRKKNLDYSIGLETEDVFFTKIKITRMCENTSTKHLKNLKKN